MRARGEVRTCGRGSPVRTMDMRTQFAADHSADTLPDPNWWPDIETVVPVVRWAILAKHKPLLTEDRVKSVHATIESVWNEWSEQYRAKVAEVTGLAPDELR